MKKFIMILVAVLLIGAAIMSFLYFGNFSEGTRAGRLVKLSKKGIIFKTWEGQLDMETLKLQPGATNTWEFSIDDDDVAVINTMDQFNGKLVKLHYEEKYMKFFWKGDTKYFITKVEPVNQ